MTNYNDGNWHGWNGGKCPVHPKTKVDAVWFSADGDVIMHPCELAKDLIWGKDRHGEILAFRVIEEHREPRVWWVWESDGGDLILSRKGAHGAFKIREVIE